MKDIIEQIIEIDLLAFENKKKNEEYLKNKRREYENKIVEYRQAMLENAKSKSEEIVFRADKSNSSGDKAKKYTVQIEDKYSQIEERMIKLIFNELFDKCAAHTPEKLK